MKLQRLLEVLKREQTLRKQVKEQDRLYLTSDYADGYNDGASSVLDFVITILEEDLDK